MGVGASNYPRQTIMITMNEIKFDSNMFINGMHLKGSTKTSANLSTETEKERVCSTCGRYKDKKCKYIGKIKNPNCSFCSWYKKEEDNE